MESRSTSSGANGPAYYLYRGSYGSSRGSHSIIVGGDPRDLRANSLVRAGVTARPTRVFSFPFVFGTAVRSKSIARGCTWSAFRWTFQEIYLQITGPPSRKRCSC